MGKKRHIQDKLWMTYQDLKIAHGDSSNRNSEAKAEKFLPFNYCSLSLEPFENPLCDSDGNIFEYKYIIPYIAKFHKNPINNKELNTKQLIKLNFFKQNNVLSCPISLKEFNDKTKTVAIKETGNVYSYDAYEQLNKNPKNYVDLITDTPFDINNVIVLNDPKNKKVISSFAFISNEEEVSFISTLVHKKEHSDSAINLPSNYAKIITEYDSKADTEEQKKKMQIINSINNSENIELINKFNENVKKEYSDFQSSIKDINKEKSVSKIKEKFLISSNCFLYHIKQNNLWKKFRASLINSSLTSDGKMATSLTSTGIDLSTISDSSIPKDEDLRLIYQNIIKSKQSKGYVTLVTSLGEINIEILCYKAPYASENFIELCQSGFFDGMKFHRLVKNFVVQAGELKEQKAKDKYGLYSESYFGKKFKDEFDQKNELVHMKGMLSMANSGKNTNTTQFFIVLGDKCSHLNNKHTIFGRVVGGINVVDIINAIGNDKNEVPLKDIFILKANVYNNPFRETIRSLIMKEILDEQSEMSALDKEKKEIKYKEKIAQITQNKDMEIGKYLNKKRTSDDTMEKISQLKETEGIYTFEKKKKKNALFSDWN